MKIQKTLSELSLRAPSDARKTVAKVKKISKPVCEENSNSNRWRTASQGYGKSKVAAIFKKGKDAIRRTRTNK